ncbi:hypothetical protein [Tautonia plasticadhaerens]|uniref:Uncharacterized protein n=1 Tax=Tautonia plasticadhaerens TaxID=2527974 RepID=A0A518HFR6_9BACT|nr:hypothetical protein [Tautonia plasticadhaerens]QDV39692.1 hypothetical protein ElP_76650 [Tautonia plasticadhaerens]
MLDEKNQRRPDAVLGRPIRLADGQRWIFPDPPTRPGPGEDETGGLRESDYLAMVAEVAESDSQPDRLRNELALMIHLLTRNYDLEPADVKALLRFPEDDPGHAEFRDVSRQVAAEHVRWYCGQDASGCRDLQGRP